MNDLIQVAAGAIGSLGFGILFNTHGKRLFYAALGGVFSWGLFLLLGRFIHGEAVRYFLVALCLSLYAEIMARILKTPTTTFIVTSLIPLIPGGSLYYTMSAALEQDKTEFLGRAVYTLQLAAALALGIIVTTTVMRMIARNNKKRS